LVKALIVNHLGKTFDDSLYLYFSQGLITHEVMEMMVHAQYIESEKLLRNEFTNLYEDERRNSYVEAMQNYGFHGKIEGGSIPK
jgi:hypothetical protein